MMTESGKSEWGLKDYEESDQIFDGATAGCGPDRNRMGESMGSERAMCEQEFSFKNRRAKVIFRTRAQAEKAARGSRFALYPYKCQTGEHWHLTSNPSSLKKSPEPLTKAERRHTLNRLADIKRQIDRGFARLAEEKFEEAYRRWQAEQRARWLAEDLAADIERQRTVLRMLGIK